MKIAICTFAFVAADELVRMVRSADSARHEVRFYLSLHSQRPNVVEACEQIRVNRPTSYFPYGYNRGLARSLNDAMLQAYADGADVVINCNDDAVWSPGDVDRLAEAALDQRDCYGITAWGKHSYSEAPGPMAWCVFAINPIALEQVGCLDENFFPAYHEDIDYSRRASLLGLRMGQCDQTSIYHEGSFSIGMEDALRQANNASFVKNRAYWNRKWNVADVSNAPTTEGYQTPFNLGGSLRINPENRRAPYPVFDREDLAKEPLL